MAKKGVTKWSDVENEATVACYLSMLKKELAGVPIIKTAENKALRRSLQNRTKGSVEYKFQNISAVLLENGWLFIEGYKPARNIQARLRDVVARQVANDIELEALMESRVASLTDDGLAVVDDHAGSTATIPVVEPPNIRFKEPKWQPRESGIKRDFIYRDANNRELGLAGEVAVVASERARLESLGASSLADRVKHVSMELGDGLGYDIHSFETDGTDRLIEVKTTVHGSETPFFLSRNELRASEHFGDRFHLYRLFNFAKDSRSMYQLSGSLSEVCALTPASYHGRPRLK